MACWCGKIIDNNRRNKLRFASGCGTVINFSIFKKECAEMLLHDQVITRQGKITQLENTRYEHILG
jgi:hypothetical protein